MSATQVAEDLDLLQLEEGGDVDQDADGREHDVVERLAEEDAVLVEDGLEDLAGW